MTRLKVSEEVAKLIQCHRPEIFRIYYGPIVLGEIKVHGLQAASLLDFGRQLERVIRVFNEPKMASPFLMNSTPTTLLLSVRI